MLKLLLSWVKLKDRIRRKDKPRGSAAQVQEFAGLKSKERSSPSAENFAAPEPLRVSHFNPPQPRDLADLAEWEHHTQKSNSPLDDQHHDLFNNELRDLGRELFGGTGFDFGWNRN
jgi:hypothetical protein